MAILPDWLTSGQYSGGLLRDIGAPTIGYPNLLDRLNRGLSDNSMMLIGLGSDIMKGGFSDGFQRAMQGAMSDRQEKSTRQAQETALKYIAGQQSIDPQLKRAMLENPALAAKYVHSIAKPPEFKTAGPYFGIFQDGEFKVQGTIPELKALEPRKIAAYHSPIIPSARPGAGSSDPSIPIQRPESKLDEGPRAEREISRLQEMKRYNESLPLWRSMIQNQTKDSTVADIEFVDSMAKIFDPNSLVREGEVKLVGRAQSIPENLQEMMRRVAFGEERLTPQTRARILETTNGHLQELKRAR
jgi:hypothetical protein